jgi:hypothetical protein
VPLVVEDISNDCRLLSIFCACSSAGRVGGFIGYINHGCRGVDSCRPAARSRSIDGISYECNNIEACENLANGYDGYASVNLAVVSCCNEVSECTGSEIPDGILPDQCGTSSPTSKVRILSHALYDMHYVQFINF